MKKTVYIRRASFLFLLILPFFGLSQPAGSKEIDVSEGKKEPSISKEPFGETAGQQVYQYTLMNSNGMLVKVINYGGSKREKFVFDSSVQNVNLNAEN